MIMRIRQRYCKNSSMVKILQTELFFGIEKHPAGRRLELVDRIANSIVKDVKVKFHLRILLKEVSGLIMHQKIATNGSALNLTTNKTLIF